MRGISSQCPIIHFLFPEFPKNLNHVGKLSCWCQQPKTAGRCRKTRIAFLPPSPQAIIAPTIRTNGRQIEPKDCVTLEVEANQLRNNAGSDLWIGHSSRRATGIVTVTATVNVTGHLNFTELQRH